jgi:predicted acyl esterase
VTALRPPHLAAICPWEGFTDVFRDFARPGGIREDGFIRVWSAGVRRQGRTDEDLRRGQIEHPLRDEWWTTRTPELERIEVPILACGSFSDQQLHSRGSFRAFERAGSPRRWLYTHRGGKWATYYSEEALSFQSRFFDYFLKSEQNGMLEVPPVRLEVREDRDTIREVRFEGEWPLPQTRWMDPPARGRRPHRHTGERDWRSELRHEIGPHEFPLGLPGGHGDQRPDGAQVVRRS